MRNNASRNGREGAILAEASRNKFGELSKAMARRDKRSRSYNAEVSLTTVPLLKCLVFGLVRGYYYAPEGRAPLVTPLERRQRPVHGMPSLERTRVAADRTRLPSVYTHEQWYMKQNALPGYPYISAIYGAILE